jgi:hypothetical protein
MYYNATVSGYPYGLTFAFAPFSIDKTGILKGELTTNRNVDFFLEKNGYAGNAGQVVLNQDFATDIKLDMTMNVSWLL